jgi:hypothetical protein
MLQALLLLLQAQPQELLQHQCQQHQSHRQQHQHQLLLQPLCG